MAAPLVSDALWSLFASLLPPRPKGGRPPIDDRAALTGIVFVLKSGIPWEMLPQEMGCGCGMTWLAMAARLAGRRQLAGLPPRAPRPAWPRGLARLEPTQLMNPSSMSLSAKVTNQLLRFWSIGVASPLPSPGRTSRRGASEP
jgi:hypothetical protein